MNEGGVKVVTAEGEIVYVPPGSKVFVNGAEIPDPTPVEMPIGYEVPESLESMMMRMVRAVSAEISNKGGESIDEANDFEVDDDGFEDVLTDAEMDAISVAPEMKEEFEREQASRDSRRSGGAEEDDGVERGVGRRNGRDGGGRSDAGERVSDRDERRSKGVARDGEDRRRRDAEIAEDSGEGDE